MSDHLDERIRELMGEVDRVAPSPPEFAALPAIDQRRRASDMSPAAGGGGRGARGRLVALTIAATVAVAGAIVIARQAIHHVPTISPDPDTAVSAPLTPTSVAPTTDLPTVTTAPSGSTTSTTAATTPAPALIVHPFGSRSDAIDIRVIDANVAAQTSATSPGAVVLAYELQIGFDPKNLDSTVQPPTSTTDGQLAIETSCATPGCLTLHPVNDLIQTKVELSVRRTGVDLTPGEHLAPFTIHFADGTTEGFSIDLYAEPAPSEAISTVSTTLTGPPTRIQTVFDVGHFGYHLIEAFGSIWSIGLADRTVIRIDAVTGAVLASIPIGVPGKRLAASADSVFVAGDPVLRIDPATNGVSQVTAPGLTVNARAVIADGGTLWTASSTDGIHRIDPDGTVTAVQPAHPAAWIDLAVSPGKVWALGADADGARLVSFDLTTSEPVDDLTIPIGPNLGLPVRLVADAASVVVGIDPRTGGANGFQSNGQLVVVDPATAEITATVPLAVRPEGIILTPRHIWTSGAVLDRASLAVTPITLGFTIARGPDGSIWATTGVPGTADNAAIAIRYAPGDASG